MSIPRDARRRYGAGSVLVLAAVVAVAVNLRAPVAGVGPVLEEIRSGTGLSVGAAGFLTSLPALCFAAIGLASPWLARTLGTTRAITAALVLLAVALVVRVTGASPTLLVGSVAACAGIAAVNVLLPVVVKERFGHRVGTVTGLYTSALAGGSAVAAAVTAPLAVAAGPGGWRIALAVWALPCVVAVALWVAASRRDPRGTPVVRPRERVDRRLVHHPVVWGLTVFFGAQSLIFYTILGWLPAVYRDAGLDAATAGTLLAVCVLIGVPTYFVVPVLAARRPGQRAWAVGLTAAAVAGFAGLLVAPAEGAWLWAVLLGLGNATFPLTMSLFALRTSSPAQTAAVSAAGQSAGYLIAAVGPIGAGLLREATGSWTAPILALLAVLVVQAGAGMLAGRSGQL
ncbi:CynX/NimT family MFS transporter [Georgenia faecalis]|uniref:CynX/NimT family MFS transporter n=1 Tax=Georgenia faecalis TaxID=2483799 RepID=A0ABV9DCS6_9MICO|nr:MFS transporter [Georgenia faecalis]